VLRRTVGRTTLTVHFPWKRSRTLAPNTQAARAQADGKAVKAMSALRIAAVLLLTLVVAACSSKHSSTIGPVRDRVLPLRNPKVAERLEVEAQYDATVRQWLADEGQPDYIMVESRSILRLFYIQKDYMVVFRRLLRPVSEYEVVNGIGAFYHKNFSDADRNQLAEIRYGRAGMEMPDELQPKRPAVRRGSVRASTPDQ